MKLALANSVRTRYISAIMAYLAEQGEDVALVTSNTCNLPIVEDGEEGVLEVVVKVVKKDYDECMQERADYVAKVAENAERRQNRNVSPPKRRRKPMRKRKRSDPLFFLTVVRDL